MTPTRDSQSYVVSSDLTVTVHNDGHVTWSSPHPMTRPQVEREICASRMHCDRRLAHLRELSDAMNSAADNITAEEVMSELRSSHPGPGIPPLSAVQHIGEVRLELREYMQPKDSAPIMATIATALSLRGYSCVRSRTRVTVRLTDMQRTHTKPPDFICTR